MSAFLIPSSAAVLVSLALAICSARLAAQQSTAFIDAPVVVGSVSTDFRALADLDGDGRKEAISVNFTDPATIVVTAWRFGTSAPTVGWQTTYGNIAGGSTPATTLAVGDFNADGREDFALSVNNYIGWWFSNGATAPPTVFWVLIRPSTIISMITADLNHDGRSDLVAMNASDIEVFLTPWVGVPTVSSSVVAPPSITLSSGRLFNAEVNGDGHPDVGVSFVNYNLPVAGPQVWLYPIIGGAISTHTVVGPIVGGQGFPVAVAGDIDGDGDEDIVVFAINRHVTLRRTGPSAYQIEPQIVGAWGSVLADVNGDGRLDAVGYASEQAGQPSISGSTTAAFYVQLNDGAGGFRPPEVTPALGWSTLAGVADLDGDGDLDFVGGRCVFWTTQRQQRQTDLTAFADAYGWTPFDAERDGDPDLAMRAVSLGTPYVTTLTTIRNEGNGTFASVTNPLNFPGSLAGSAVIGPGVPGDFNGDGTIDLLVGFETPPATMPGTRLLLNASGGGLVDGGPATAAGQSPFYSNTLYFWAHPISVLVADVDLDGDLDLVMRTPTGPGGYGVAGSEVWLNNGAGFFTSSSFWAGGPLVGGIMVLAVADFDGDQIPDALGVTPNGASVFGSLQLLHGTGNGQFAPSGTTIDAGFDVRFELSVADADGDGDLDIAVADYTGVGWLRNAGNGTFTASYFATTPLGGSNPYPAFPPETTSHAFFVDVNGDGLLDLVGGPLAVGRDTSAVCIATAPGVFAPPIIQMFLATKFADVDGDGDPDAITANSVRFGTHFRTPDAGVRLQHGTGLAGTLGFEPVIGDVGPFRAGYSGAMLITNGLGGAPGYLGLGMTETSVPVAGGLLQVTPDILLPIQLGGPVNAPGAGSTSIPWTMPPGLAGLTIHHQAAFADPGAPQGISFTRVVSVTIGS